MFKLKPLSQAIALSLVAGIAVAAVPGGAILQNQVTATYKDIGGKSYTAESNVVEISIREVRNATLTETSGAAQTVPAASGSKVYSIHTLTNTGNVTETYALSAANVTGGGDTLDADALKIYVDANGNGQLDSGEVEATSIDLAAGASAQLIVETTLPATIAASDTLNVTLDAEDSQGNVASSTNTVEITFIDTNVITPVITWEQTAGGNCHAYSLVSDTLTWTDAKAAAEGLMYQGVQGHLVTLTSAEEDTFVLNDLLNNDPFAGAGGPWLGFSSVAGATPTWVTGEAWSFTKWDSQAKPGGSYGRTLSSYPYGYYTSAGWGIHNATRTGSYVVEFDIDCALPDVAIAMEGAKDVDCDGTADDAFGTARLEEMGSGECAIMRSRATNNGASKAVDVILNSTLPDYATFIDGSMKLDGTAQTDADGDDAGTYDATAKKVSINVGDVEVGATSADAEYSVKID